MEKTELYKNIWKLVNDLRGSVDGWDFKQYVFSTMFYKFLSTKMELTASEVDFKNSTNEDVEYLKDDIINKIGYFIYPSDLFDNVNLDSTEDLSLKLFNIYKSIEQSAVGFPSEKQFKGIFDDVDLKSNKLGSTIESRNEKVIALLTTIGSIDHTESSIDILGDAYEYMMTLYASNAGKSGGEYYTPQEVSELLAKITCLNKEKVANVYDPTCGTGSLLLKFAKTIGVNNVLNGFYGQELNITSYNLCRMNMLLHNVKYDRFDIANGNTLLDPINSSANKFEAIVANPPYSVSWIGNKDPKLLKDERFAPAGVLAPNSNSDLAFIMHSLWSLSDDGVATIVEFPGVLYRGNAEQKIRKYLVDNNFIDAIIQLPGNIFFGTTIQTIIIVLKKNRDRKNILFIDASNQFVKSGTINQLSTDNISTILSAYDGYKDVDKLCRVVEQSEIINLDYSLSVGSYVDIKDDVEEVDIKKLNADIREIVAYQNKLRQEVDAIIADLEGENDEQLKVDFVSTFSSNT